MIGLDNPLHIAIVLVVVLLVFGAKRLPEMGKSLGEGIRGFKDSISGEAPAANLVNADATPPSPPPAPQRPASAPAESEPIPDPPETRRAA